MDIEIQALLTQVADLGELSETQARRIMEDVYTDGIVSRGEAEALFAIHQTLRHSDPLWADRFAEALKDFVLRQEAPIGSISDDEGRWLIRQAESYSPSLPLDVIDVFINLLRAADRSPAFFGHFVLGLVCDEIKSKGRASKELTERARSALFAPGSDGGVWVSRVEAALLFETNDEIGLAKNDAAWNDLFARAIANHLLARSHPSPQTEKEMLAREAWLADRESNVFGMVGKIGGSFSSGRWFENVTYSQKKAAAARQAAKAALDQKAAEVTDDENSWLMDRLGWNEKSNPAERALIDFMKDEMPGLAEGLASAT